MLKSPTNIIRRKQSVNGVILRSVSNLRTEPSQEQRYEQQKSNGFLKFLLSQNSSKIMSDRLNDEDYRRSPPPLDIRRFKANNTVISSKDSDQDIKIRKSTKILKESQSSKEILNIPTDNDREIFQTLHEDNVELTHTVKDLERKLTDTISQLEKRTNSFAYQLRIQKQLCRAKDQEIKQLLQRELKSQFQQVQKENQEQSMKQKINDLELENQRLTVQLSESHRKVNELERRINQMQGEIREIEQHYEDELHLQSKELDELRKQQTSWIFEKQRVSKVPTHRKSIMMDNESILMGPSRLTLTALPLVDEHHQEDDDDNQSIKSQSESLKRSTNKKKDFRPTINLLKYKLKSLNISFHQFDEYLFSNLPTQDGTIAAEDLIYQLQKFPCQLTNEDVIYSLIDYIFDSKGQKPEKLERVKSIFKTLLDNYRLFSLDEQTKLENELHKHLTINSIKIIESMKRYSKGNQFRVRDLVELIKYMDMPLSQNHIEQLLQVIYETSENRNIEEFEWGSLMNALGRHNSFNHIQRPTQLEIKDVNKIDDEDQVLEDSPKAEIRLASSIYQQQNF